MIGISVALVNPASDNRVFVRLQIKDNDDAHQNDNIIKSELQMTAAHEKHKIDAFSDSPVTQHNSQSRSSSYSSQLKPYETKSCATSGSTSHLNQSTNSFRQSNLIGQSVRGKQSALEKTEPHCSVLMHKLEEAQTNLELQNMRLNRAESVVKDNSVLVEDLKFKERDYRKTVSLLEASEKWRQQLQLENLRLQEEMRDRVRALEHQLRTLRTQYENVESINYRRNTLLDHTATTLALIEEKNTKLQHDKEKLQSEVTKLKEALDLNKAKFDTLEDDKRNMKNESLRLKEDNTSLSQKIQEMVEQMIELRSLLQTVREENDYLSSKWRASTEDQSQAARLAEEYQRTISDLKSQLISANAECNRLVNEKQELSRKLQREELDKEQLIKKLTKTNDSFQEEAALQRSQVEVWKNTCEQLTTSVTQKEAELWSLTGRCNQMEDTISGLKQEIKTLKDENAVLSERNKVAERYSSEEKSTLRQVVETLKQQLENAKENQLSQDKMIKNLKEKNLEDANSEMQQLKTNLLELRGEMEHQRHIIENLQIDLRSSKDLAEAKQNEVQELHKTVEKLEGENQMLHQDIQTIHDLILVELSAEKQSEPVKSSQEDQAELGRSKEKDHTLDDLFSKSLKLQEANAPSVSTEPVPDKTTAKGGSHLQTLISKYRSHSEKEETTPQRAAKPLSGVIPQKLVSKSAFDGTAPKVSIRHNNGTESTASKRLPASPSSKSSSFSLLSQK